MAKVSFKNVTKSFGKIMAVDNFNLDIDDGEFIVLVGPSGCGKTTSLRMLAGLEEISRGEISIGGNVVNSVPPKDRNIAMVFQNYALYPHMTVFDNMAFGLNIRHFPENEIKELVNNASKILGIESLLHRKPKALSGGQRQRVAMGRAIVRNPEVFLFDEPLSNLDAKLRVQMRIELKMLQRKLKTTTVYVTHDQIEAMTLADRIAIMEKGILRQVGTPSDVFEHPANIFVAGFIGTPSMNFLDGEISKDNQQIYINTGAFKYSPSKEIGSLIEKSISTKVILGIRPHHLSIKGKDSINIPAHMITLTGQVVVIENMGSEKYIHINSNGIIIVLCVDAGNTIKEGENISVILDSSEIHIFDEKGDKFE